MHWYWHMITDDWRYVTFKSRAFLSQFSWLMMLPLPLCVSRSVVSDSLRPHGLVAHQAPPSIGFSRREYWSGLPFPSPIASIGACIVLWLLLMVSEISDIAASLWEKNESCPQGLWKKNCLYSPSAASFISSPTDCQTQRQYVIQPLT